MTRLGPFLLLFVVCALADHASYRNYKEYIRHGDAPTQRYKSSKVDSPIFNIDIWNQSAIETETAPYIFFSTGDGGHSGPYVFSSKDLSLVYTDRTWRASNNARVQQWKNKTYLTFWEGDQGKGHAEGICHMVDSSYKDIRKFKSQKLHAKTDLHECRLTEWGTALITVYESTPFDLRGVNGPEDGLMKDSVFEELDIETGKLLFQWRASDHIPYTESYSPYQHKAPGWDPYHINSLQKDAEGNYYVSLRRLHALVKINGRTGSRMWQLGGKMNNFTDLSDGHATNFAWQHHMQLYNNFTLLTLFDNHNLHSEREVHCIGPACSRGARIALDHDKMTARLLQNFYSPTGLVSYAMGSFETLPNGNALIGWGTAEITEYSPDGMPVMNIQFGKVGSWRRTYRVYKGDWKGFPTWPPGMAIGNDDEGQMRVYASWNGATEVTTWVVAASNDRNEVLQLAPRTPKVDFPKKGFESDVRWNGPERFIRVAAIDKYGVVLGATGIVDHSVPGGKPETVAEGIADLRYDARSHQFVSIDSNNPPSVPTTIAQPKLTATTSTSLLSSMWVTSTASRSFRSSSASVSRSYTASSSVTPTSSIETVSMWAKV